MRLFWHSSYRHLFWQLLPMTDRNDLFSSSEKQYRTHKLRPCRFTSLKFLLLRVDVSRLHSYHCYLCLNVIKPVLRVKVKGLLPIVRQQIVPCVNLRKSDIGVNSGATNPP
mmetsp:Transcript_18294/g.42118  ORF Transcript_18294/g.42118 Transcript_18294/m.42118 type:complete len:111 (+) Transcript_18294:1541-1873(+)